MRLRAAWPSAGRTSTWTRASFRSDTRSRKGRASSPRQRPIAASGPSALAQRPSAPSGEQRRRQLAALALGRATMARGRLRVHVRVGSLLDGRNVIHELQAVLARAGLPRQRFHDLRHAYATLTLEAGEDLAMVSREPRSLEHLDDGRQLRARHARDAGTLRGAHRPDARRVKCGYGRNQEAPPESLEGLFHVRK